MQTLTRPWKLFHFSLDTRLKYFTRAIYTLITFTRQWMDRGCAHCDTTKIIPCFHNWRHTFTHAETSYTFEWKCETKTRKKNKGNGSV